MHGHEGETVKQEYMELMTNLAHWGFEFTTSIVQFILISIVAFFWVKYHDKNHHNGS